MYDVGVLARKPRRYLAQASQELLPAVTFEDRDHWVKIDLGHAATNEIHCCSKHNTVVHNLGEHMETKKTSSSASEQWVQEHISLWRRVTLEQGNRTDLWGLEVLRNLVLLNAAGLAGAMAAFQVKGVAEQMFWPATGFLAGIGMGCLAIAIGWLLHRIAAARYQSNAKVFSESKNVDDLFAQNLCMLKGVNGVAIVAGLISFGAFFWGAYRLLKVFF